MNPLPDLTPLRQTIEMHFPAYWPAVDLGLATCATLLLADNSNPVAVIYVGAASSGKTTVASMFEGATIDVNGTPQDLCYRSDNFTPASFVSHAANVSTSKLGKIDLLPQIKDKVLLTPELAPIFRGKEDDLNSRFSTLIRVLDGQGYQTNSGTHGRRGSADAHMFAWLGCTTPFEEKVWRVMAQLGSRLFFLLMETPQAVTVDELLASDQGPSYQERLNSCKQTVHVFLRDLFAAAAGIRQVTWNQGADSSQARRWLVHCAKLLAAMRSEPVEERDSSSAKVIYRPGSEEQPFRARSVLSALARGHALVHGRRQLTEEDLPIIVRVAVSSMPTDRGTIFKALAAAGGQLTVEQARQALGVKSLETARRRMEYFDALGVMEFVETGTGKPAYLRFRTDWAWCASPEFTALLQGNVPPVLDQALNGSPEPVKNRGVCASSSTPNLVQRQERKEGVAKRGHRHTPQEMTGSSKPKNTRNDDLLLALEVA